MATRDKNDKRSGKQDSRGRGKEEAVPGGSQAGTAPARAPGDRGYVLLESHHYGPGGEKYEKDQVVYSRDPLARMFPGKFRRANPNEMNTGRAEQFPDEDADEDVGTSHLGTTQVVQLAEIESQEDTGEEAGGGEGTPTPGGSGQKADVTEDFPRAEKHELKVLQTDHGFEVLHEDDSPVDGAAGAFPTEAKLNEFLAGYESPQGDTKKAKAKGRGKKHQ